MDMAAAGDVIIDQEGAKKIMELSHDSAHQEVVCLLQFKRTDPTRDAYLPRFDSSRRKAEYRTHMEGASAEVLASVLYAECLPSRSGDSVSLAIAQGYLGISAVGRLMRRLF